MYIKKVLAKAAMIGALSFAMFNAPIAWAADKYIEATGTYFMDSRLNETGQSATARALEDAKRQATEQAGVLITATSVVADNELSQDEIVAVATQVLKFYGEKHKVEVVNDNILKYSVTVRAKVDKNNDDLLKSITDNKKRLAELTRQNNELRREYDKVQREMAALKERYATASPAEQIELKSQSVLNNMRFNATGEFEKGNAFYIRGDYDQAATAYTKAAAELNNSPQLHNNRGLAYYHLHRLTEATADFDRAIALDRAFAGAYNNRGIIAADRGNYSLAIKDYTAAIAANPRFAEAYNNRANAYAATAQYKKAENDYMAALEIADNNAEIHVNLGSIYFSQNRMDEAMAHYNRAVAIAPDYADALYNRAALYYTLGRYVDAYPDAQRAAELHPNNRAFNDLLAKIRKKLRR